MRVVSPLALAHIGASNLTDCAALSDENDFRVQGRLSLPISLRADNERLCTGGAIP